MDVEALDRELIIERAEAVRFWLLGLPLTHRATGAIQRELGAIIDNDPGNYMNGQRPLAGLTVADFIAELHRPNGGAVGRVRSVGYAALDELRAKIPPGAGGPQGEPAEPEDTIDYSIPDLAPPPDSPKASAPAASDSLPEPPAAAPEPGAEPSPPEPLPARRRPGRPRGSTKAAKSAAAAASVSEPPPAAGAPKRPRGRPRREAAPLARPPEAPVATSSAPEAPAPAPAPAESLAGPLAPAGDDPLLKQIARLWPELHPHARRALVTYASELWAEAGYAG